MADHPTQPAEPSPFLRPALLALAIPAVLFAVDPWRRSTEAPSVVVGTILVLSGLAMIDRAIRDRRPAEEAGDLATGGLYAHSRNPEDLGILAVLSGLAMASRSPAIGVYLIATAIALHLRIVTRREPRLAADVPDRWVPYRDTVPRWFPRPTRPGRAG
jgi:protein-S-isoprenylcysteine O-methyltransferase Ste14